MNKLDANEVGIFLHQLQFRNVNFILEKKKKSVSSCGPNTLPYISVLLVAIMRRSPPVCSCVCATRPATYVDRPCCCSSGPPAGLPRLRLPRGRLLGSTQRHCCQPRQRRRRCRIPGPACSVRLLHVDGCPPLPLWRRLKQSWACIPN